MVSQSDLSQTKSKRYVDGKKKGNKDLGTGDCGGRERQERVESKDTFPQAQVQSNNMNHQDSSSKETLLRLLITCSLLISDS